jgi:hypothetical protein
MYRAGRGVAIGACAFLFAITCQAQPTPRLDSISPEWIQRGTTIEVTFRGTNLASVNRFIFDGETGLSATNVPAPGPAKPTISVESTSGGISRVDPPPPRDERKLVARITAAADASLGPREVRAVTPNGISNPLLINVGHLPEVASKGPNNSIEQAQQTEFPAAISGVINAAAQADYYAFKATKGQELVFDVAGMRIMAASIASLLSRCLKMASMCCSCVISGIRPGPITAIGSTRARFLTWNQSFRWADSAENLLRSR